MIKYKHEFKYRIFNPFDKSSGCIVCVARMGAAFSSALRAYARRIVEEIQCSSDDYFTLGAYRACFE